ncbi:MAG: ATP synthase F0 subunit B [Deltaproteobacteria bacterium]|jgi:F-type H+-transporting ATPase subunit b|nr:ATP synthase F0 subunit B [Deltaproteobacteria bacterium]
MVSVSLDISLFIQILNFLVLTLVLNLFLFKPLRKILQERETLFESFRQLADVAKKQLEDGEEEMTRRRAEALSHGLETMNGLKAVGQEREREILTTAHDDSARRLEEARTNLAQQTAQVRVELSEETKKLASGLASQLLGRQL